MDECDEERGGKRRRLQTPTRNLSRLPQKEDHGPELRRSKSKELCHTPRQTSPVPNSDLQERERVYERALARLIEKEIQKDRESRRRSRVQEPTHSTRERRRSRTPEHRGRGRQSRNRSGSRERRRNFSSKSPSCRRSSHNDVRKSRSPVFTIGDVTQIVHSIKGKLPSQPSNASCSNFKNMDYRNILPDFDPSSKNQRINAWLKKVNECALVYGWDDKTTVHFAMQKLQGLAKIWYESLDTILFSWKEWQQKLMSAFPGDQNYGQLLDEMLKRKSRPNEPIDVYYYEKLALLHQCNINGKRAVDCIIHGISDRTMKSSALALRCSNSDQLLEFLMSNKESGSSFERELNRFRNSSDNSREINQSTKFVKKVSTLAPFCYNCKLEGHQYRQCTKPLLKCNICNKIGHNTDKCYRATENESVKTEVQKTMCI